MGRFYALRNALGIVISVRYVYFVKPAIIAASLICWCNLPTKTRLSRLP
ncbi:MAG: hypothetical protein ACOVQA_13315 [Thermoflexibacteraceae bacterium]